MTQSDFNTKYGRIAMPMPFAGATGAALASIAHTSGSVMNFPDGFPQNYSAPHSRGGKYVTRGEMNAVGNLASRNDFFRNCGGINTFDAAISAAIGGYPAGAVLEYLEGYQLFKVISLVDNNTVNFNNEGVDGVNWKILNQNEAQFDSESLITSCSIHPQSNTYLDDGTTLSALDYFDVITAIKAPITGTMFLKNVNLKAVMSERFSSNATTIKSFMGSGVMFKDLGTDPSALENIQIPTWNNQNGWKQFGGSGTSTWGVQSTQENKMVHQWMANESIPLIIAGHYIAIAIAFGFSRVETTNPGTSPKHYYFGTSLHGIGGDDQNITFDIFMRK